ncbi:MAG: undecaprenyl-diphosphate phosphatase [Acidobacteria bacterium]|nr:undecaprenyl-diphosphate phosphatase [Acidobacteriota bacterium]
MPLLHALILALVQALTEFLPVSSSAHLILTPWLLGWPYHGLLFDIALHLGTLVAVLLYFAKTWVRIAFLAIGREVLKPKPGEIDHDLYANPRLLWLLVAATFPAGISGLFLKDFIESVLRSPAVIGVMLIVVGLLMAAVEKRGGLIRDLNRVSFGDAMTVGCAQALALIPGTSRSGITITTAMFLEITRHSAARFSFLLSTPIILGAGLKAFLDAMETGGIPPEMHTAFAVGVIASAIFGYAVISLFLRYLQKATLKVFVYYRVILGVIVLALTFLTNFGR